MLLIGAQDAHHCKHFGTTTLIDQLMDSTLPERLGIWRLGSKIHANPTFRVNFGQPVDAIDSPRWDYAVKIGLNSEGRDGIARSIAASAMVAHPNLAPILDGDVAGKHPFLVMPKLDGATMNWHLTSGPRKPLPVALWLVRQMCQGLAALHSKGWTHGDIKPENVIVAVNGHVTLIDFAFSHHGTMTPSAPFRGTPEYAAPELLANASSGSPASDIFALGKILQQWTAHVDTSNQAILDPVSNLVKQMAEESPQKRPNAEELTGDFLRLEIDTLGEHIVPAPIGRAA